LGRWIDLWRYSIKQLRPEIKIIGVEPVDTDAMYQSLAGHRVRLSQVGLFADGVRCGENLPRLSQQYVDGIIWSVTLVPRLNVFEDTRSILNRQVPRSDRCCQKPVRTKANPGTNLGCRCLRCQHEL